MADFIIAYCEEYSTELRTSKHSLVDHLLKKGHRVLYIENPESFLKSILTKKKLMRNKTVLKNIENNLWILRSTDYLPYFRGIFDILLLNRLINISF